MIFINDSFFLDDRPWLGLNNMIFFCVEKFHIFKVS